MHWNTIGPVGAPDRRYPPAGTSGTHRDEHRTVSEMTATRLYASINLATTDLGAGCELRRAGVVQESRNG